MTTIPHTSPLTSDCQYPSVIIAVSMQPMTVRVIFIHTDTTPHRHTDTRTDRGDYKFAGMISQKPTLAILLIWLDIHTLHLRDNV